MNDPDDLMAQMLGHWKKYTQPVTNDFEVLLNYVEAHRPALTPKQGLIPVRHVLKMMESFLVKEPFEEKVGSKIFRKRFEDEFPRFYFLDLLAVGSRILSEGRGGKMTPGKYFKKYFEWPPFYRPAALFYNFCYGFNLEEWFPGGDFGASMMLKAPLVWHRIFPWMKKGEVLWEPWAKCVIKECGLSWNAAYQGCAEESMIWGLKQCFIVPMNYFGMVEMIEAAGKYGPELSSVQLTIWGKSCLDRLQAMLVDAHPQVSGGFSLN